jgi:hypothetical protein
LSGGEHTNCQSNHYRFCKSVTAARKKCHVLEVVTYFSVFGHNMFLRNASGHTLQYSTGTFESFHKCPCKPYIHTNGRYVCTEWNAYFFFYSFLAGLGLTRRQRSPRHDDEVFARCAQVVLPPTGVCWWERTQLARRRRVAGARVGGVDAARRDRDVKTRTKQKEC